MSNRTLKSYLEGVFNNEDPFRQLDGYLERQLADSLEGFDNKEDQVRRTLAAEGPQIVIPTFYVILPILKSWGAQLAQILIEPSRLYSTTLAGPRIDNTYFRVCNLVREMASSSSYAGRMVGEQVRIALNDRDEDVRVLATLHSVAGGIAYSIVSDTVIHLSLQEDDPLIKTGAALATFGFPDIPEKVSRSSMDVVRIFLENIALGSFPELAEKMSTYFSDPALQYYTVATLAVYRLLAIRLFNKASGRPVSASLVH